VVEGVVEGAVVQPAYMSVGRKMASQKNMRAAMELTNWRLERPQTGQTGQEAMEMSLSQT
jgi:hypothetical protein